MFYQYAQLTGIANVEITTYNAEEPENVTVRQDLRKLHELAVARQNYWATQRWIAPAPPRSNRRMPPT